MFLSLSVSYSLQLSQVNTSIYRSILEASYAVLQQ